MILQMNPWLCTCSVDKGVYQVTYVFYCAHVRFMPRLNLYHEVILHVLILRTRKKQFNMSRRTIRFIKKRKIVCMYSMYVCMYQVFIGRYRSI